jgi:hypothetical protein
MICETELKPQFGAAVQTGGISRRLPVLRWLFLTLIFSLLWFREYSSADGPRSFLYLEAWGGFRWIDFMVLGLIYPHLLWILATRKSFPKIPRILKKPALLFLAALGVSLLWGFYQGGSHVYFDWRNIFLGVGLALMFSWWIRTPAALHEAAYIFAAMMGLLVFYALEGYLTGTRGVLNVIPGLATPLYDGPTLSAVVLLALLAFRFAPHEPSFFQRTWWTIVGCSAFLLVLLSFRRTIWAELAIGALILAALQRKRRLAAFGLIVVVGAFIVGLGGERVYRRAESMNPFAAGQSEYTNTNEDHINDVLDALDQVKQHPLLGIGLGRTYRTPRISDWKAESWGVHNGLLHVWLLYGLLGLVAYLWFHASLFRWLKRLQAARSAPRARAFAQVGLAYLVGPFLVSFAFSPWPYGALNTDLLVFFIIGSLLSLQAGSPRLKRG